MNKFIDRLQPAVKKETKRITVVTFFGVVLMWVICGILHMIIPEKVPLDYTVFLAGVGGGIIAVLNFFLMGLTVQKVASTQDEGMARNRMKSSYSQRMLLQMLWVIAAIAAPCFWAVAGVLPLLFPSIGIKIMGILNKNK